MNYNKINKVIEEQHIKNIEKILTNISLYYKINKKELFDKFLHTNKTVKTYKNKKKVLDKEYRCMGRKQDGTQCSRGRKFGDYCGKHNPPKFGRIDEPINEGLFKKKKTHIVVKNEKIGENEFIIEENTNIIFNTDMKKPTVIGKKLSDNEIHFIDNTNINTNDKEMINDTDSNTIVNILNKLGNIHSNDNPEEDYESFNVKTSKNNIELVNNINNINDINDINDIDDINDYDDIDEDIDDKSVEIDYN